MATITSLLGSTQIGNSDEIINQNFQNINNAIVEKTGAQTIAGKKTYTDVDFEHNVTSNTENPLMRRTNHARYTKNQNNAGGVQFNIYTDADGSITGNRERSLWGYLKKWADGTYANFSGLLSVAFDTYDGNNTYTSRTTISTDSLYFGAQNWTTTSSYTPVLTGDSGSGATVTITIAKYREFGNISYVTLRCIITSKGTCSGVVYVSSPTTTNSASGGTTLSGGIYAINTGPNNSKGWATISNNRFNFTKSSQNSNTIRSDIAVGDEVLITGRYLK